MWSEKHKPKRLEEFIGNSAVDFIRNWSGKPLIVHGGTGTGKTLLVELTAKEKGWDIVRVDNENIEDAKSIANTGSLFGVRKLMVVEDVDLIADMKTVGELVKESKSPLVLTTDDYGSKRLATIKKSCQELSLRRPMAATVAKYLGEVCRREGVSADKEVLDAIAKNSSGDFRSALNDLETLARGRVIITVKDLEVLAQRDKTSDIYKALSIIFGGRNLQEVIESTWDLEEQPKDVLWWVEENVPLLYRDNKAIHDSFQNISKADIFLGRIMNRQYWGFLRYASPLMTAGVNVSRPEKISFARYQFPSYFMSLGRSKARRKMEEGIAEKIRPVTHVSNKIAIREYLPLLKLLLKKKKIQPEELKEKFNMEDEEIEYLTS